MGLDLDFSFHAHDAVSLTTCPGAKECTLLAHANYLTRTSDYFKDVFKEDWTGDGMRVIDLEFKDSYFISHYLDYLYSRRLPTSDIVTDCMDDFADNPGHCKTALNGYRGAKDPLDGAAVVAELALAEKGHYAPGFWRCEDGVMAEVPW